MIQKTDKTNPSLAVKILSFSFCLIGCLGAIYYFYESQMMGFPDGYLSELQQTQQIAYPLYGIVLFSFALYFFYSGIDSQNKMFLVNPKWIMLLFCILMGVIWALNVFFASNLDNSGIA